MPYLRPISPGCLCLFPMPGFSGLAPSVSSLGPHPSQPLHSASLQRLDPMAMRKPPPSDEVGVPVARNGSVSGLKLQNGHASPKPPAGTPSPRHCTTPAHRPTVLEEPAKVDRKTPALQHTSPPPKNTQSPANSRPENRRQGSWDGAAPHSTSPQLHGPKVGAEGRNSRLSSPEHSAGRGSQGSDLSPGSRVDTKTIKPKGLGLGSATAPELTSLMSPPPAKRLALSAKKVGAGGLQGQRKAD